MGLYRATLNTSYLRYGKTGELDDSDPVVKGLARSKALIRLDAPDEPEVVEVPEEKEPVVAKETPAVQPQVRTPEPVSKAPDVGKVKEHAKVETSVAKSGGLNPDLGIAFD